MSLITPLDPGASPGVRSPMPAAPGVREAIHTLLFGRIACAAASSCGSVHAANEDAHTDLAHGGPLFVVADGVGGGAMASVASRRLVAQLHERLGGHRFGEEEVCAAMQAADRAIAERIAEVTQQPGAATVALCAPVNAFASRWLVAWVGDCRVYHCSAADGGAVRALTRDDTFEHLGEQAPPGGSPDDPARMVGNGAVARANVTFAEIEPGDRLLVCSDGIHKFIAPREWQALLAAPGTLLQHCDALVAQARANGSTDDATVLIARREALTGQRTQWLRGLVHTDRNPR
jgi:serine/threonine protein phosphatase PrpC